MHKRRPEKYIHRRLSKLHNSGNGDMTDDTARTFSGLPYFCLMAHAGMQLEAQAEGGGGDRRVAEGGYSALFVQEGWVRGALIGIHSVCK